MNARRTAPTLAAVLAVLALVVMVPADAAESDVRNLTPQFASNGFAIDRLQAFEVGGVVVLRGRTYDRGAAEAATLYARVLGYPRVANLIQILEAPNDIEISRAAERELAMHRSLHGSRLSVNSDKGVLVLRGRVKNEAQKDMAIAVLRSVEGVREVRAELERE